MPGGRSLAEDRVRTSKQLEMGNTGEKDRLGGRGCASGCWKMAVGARTRPGGMPQSAKGIVVPVHGPQHAGRVAEMQRQERKGYNSHHRVGTVTPGSLQRAVPCWPQLSGVAEGRKDAAAGAKDKLGRENGRSPGDEDQQTWEAAMPPLPVQKAAGERVGGRQREQALPKLRGPKASEQGCWR